MSCSDEMSEYQFINRIDGSQYGVSRSYNLQDWSQQDRARCELWNTNTMFIDIRISDSDSSLNIAIMDIYQYHAIN